MFYSTANIANNASNILDGFVKSKKILESEKVSSIYGYLQVHAVFFFEHRKHRIKVS